MSDEEDFSSPPSSPEPLELQASPDIPLQEDALSKMGAEVEQKHLSKQDLSKLNLADLTPDTYEVISRQATINVGTIGHVAHGKSTIVRSLSGVTTVRFKNEKERNITIKLGYANAKIYRNNKAAPNTPGRYTSRGSKEADKFVDEHGNEFELVRHISFVDCPGHDILMATMLNGAAVMDAALLLIAGNENCPQPQTSEHLAAVEIMKLDNIIILQNKIDLVKEDAALTQYDQIKQFVSGTVADGAPIIPISAVLKYNIDVVCEYLVERVPTPIRDYTSKPHMIVIRSFDVNKPGEVVENLKGGVAGGSIMRGVLQVGDLIEVRPGIYDKNQENKVCAPIYSRVRSLLAEANDLKYAVPGGLIGVGTNIDPTLTRADRLVGHVLGHPTHLPQVYMDVEVRYYLLKRLLGVRMSEGGKQAKVDKLLKGEVVLINIGSTSSGSRVSSLKTDEKKNEVAKISMLTPVCLSMGEKVALSRRVDGHWRLIGWGEVIKGVPVPLREIPLDQLK